MSKRSMRKLRGICSDALRAASLSAEFIAFGQANTHFSRIEGLERLRFKKRSRHCPAIAQALGLLSSSALPSCATDRLSARDRAEINQGESLTLRVQSAPRSLSARCKTFDNQQGKDVKAKQHWCPLKQDHPRDHLGQRTKSDGRNLRSLAGTDDPWQKANVLRYSPSDSLI